MSPAYEGIWGTPPARILSSAAGWPEAVLDGRPPAPSFEARRKLASGAAFEVEYRILRPDASVRWIHDRGFPVRERRTGSAPDGGRSVRRHRAQAARGGPSPRPENGVRGKAGRRNRARLQQPPHHHLRIREHAPGQGERSRPDSNEALKRVFTASRQATGLVRQLLLFSRKRSPKREVDRPEHRGREMVGACSSASSARRSSSSSSRRPSSPGERRRRDAGAGAHEPRVNARDAMPRGGTLRHLRRAAPPAGRRGRRRSRQHGTRGIRVHRRRRHRLRDPRGDPARGSSSPSSRRRRRDAGRASGSRPRRTS